MSDIRKKILVVFKSRKITFECDFIFQNCCRLSHVLGSNVVFILTNGIPEFQQLQKSACYKRSKKDNQIYGKWKSLVRLQNLIPIYDEPLNYTGIYCV